MVVFSAVVGSYVRTVAAGRPERAPFVGWHLLALMSAAADVASVVPFMMLLLAPWRWMRVWRELRSEATPRAVLFANVLGLGADVLALSEAVLLAATVVRFPMAVQSVYESRFRETLQVEDALAPLTRECWLLLLDVVAVAEVAAILCCVIHAPSLCIRSYYMLLVHRQHWTQRGIPPRVLRPLKRSIDSVARRADLGLVGGRPAAEDGGEVEEADCHFEKLPDEIVLEIFARVPPGMFCRGDASIGLVCRRWYRLSVDSALWKGIVLREFRSSSLQTLEHWRHRLRHDSPVDVPAHLAVQVLYVELSQAARRIRMDGMEGAGLGAQRAARGERDYQRGLRVIIHEEFVHSLYHLPHTLMLPAKALGLALAVGMNVYLRRFRLRYLPAWSISPLLVRVPRMVQWRIRTRVTFWKAHELVVTVPPVILCWLMHELSFILALFALMTAFCGCLGAPLWPVRVKRVSCLVELCSLLTFLFLVWLWCFHWVLPLLLMRGDREWGESEIGEMFPGGLDLYSLIWLLHPLTLTRAVTASVWVLSEASWLHFLAEVMWFANIIPTSIVMATKGIAVLVPEWRPFALPLRLWHAVRGGGAVASER